MGREPTTLHQCHHDGGQAGDSRRAAAFGHSADDLWRDGRVYARRAPRTEAVGERDAPSAPRAHAKQLRVAI